MKKRIVISGASRGIGRAACIHFLELGYEVVGISRSEPNIPGKDFTWLQADITEDASLEKEIDTILADLDVLALINCAGITLPSNGLPDLNEFKKTFDVNVFAAYRLIRLLLPNLRKSSHSTIVNVASIGGIVGFSGNPSYGASKAALINLTKNLALDFVDYGIRVNTVSPGYIKTVMTKNSFDNKRLRSIREKNTILGRYGEAEELMGAFEFLVSEKSSYVTGQNLVVDGGWISKGMIS